MRRATFALTLAAFLALMPALDAQTGMPPTLNGLAVTAEKLGHPGPRSARDYLDNIRLFSLRKGKELEATLQVGRFRTSAPSTTSFHRSIAQQVGTTVPVENRIGGHTLYVSRGKRLSIAVWFAGRDMFILSIRETYTSPKTLIRTTTQVQP